MSILESVSTCVLLNIYFFKLKKRTKDMKKTLRIIRQNCSADNSLLHYYSDLNPRVGIYIMVKQIAQYGFEGLYN